MSATSHALGTCEYLIQLGLVTEARKIRPGTIELRLAADPDNPRRWSPAAVELYGVGVRHARQADRTDRGDALADLEEWLGLLTAVAERLSPDAATDEEITKANVEVSVAARRLFRGRERVVRK